MEALNCPALPRKILIPLLLRYLFLLLRHLQGRNLIIRSTDLRRLPLALHLLVHITTSTGIYFPPLHLRRWLHLCSHVHLVQEKTLRNYHIFFRPQSQKWILPLGLYGISSFAGRKLLYISNRIATRPSLYHSQGYFFT